MPSAPPAWAHSARPTRSQPPSPCRQRSANRTGSARPRGSCLLPPRSASASTAAGGARQPAHANGTGARAGTRNRSMSGIVVAAVGTGNHRGRAAYQFVGR